MYTDQLKLYDFGLARELPSTANTDPKAVFPQTSYAGSHPYMSPESVLKKSYGLSVDTYSFGILCYEILSTKEPYHKVMSHEYIDRVILGNKRPNLDTCKDCWGPQEYIIKKLISSCWDADPTMRPTMKDVQTELISVAAAAANVSSE